MRTLAIILALIFPAFAQTVHCSPERCVTVHPPDFDNPRTPRPGETAAEYGLRLSGIRHQEHMKHRDERRRAQEAQQ